MAAIVIAICGVVVPATVAAKPLVVGLEADFTTLDATLFRTRPDMIANLLIYDALFYRDPNTMEPVPHLATDLRQVDDVTWEIALRRGVTFHDGTEMTADDVKFSFERMLDPEMMAPYRGSFTWIDRVEVLDSHTLRLHTAGPFGLVKEMLTFAYVVPERYIKEVGDREFASRPVGTGPYKVVRYTRGQELILKANESWWRGAPDIEDVTIRIIPEPSPRLAELLSGRVHLIRDLGVDQALAIERNPAARVTFAPMLRVDFLVLDGDGRAGTSPVQDLRVRQAIQHAINVDDIIEFVLDGYGVRVNAGLNPLHFGHDPDIPPVPYDPDRARALLVEAGYPNGVTITYNTYNGVPNQVSDTVHAYLEDVGIRVDRRHFDDSSAFIQERNAGRLNGIFELSWGSQSIFDADQIFFPLLHSSDIFTYNTSEEVDRWLEEARFSTDPERRKALYSQVQRHLLEQAWWVPMYARYALEGVSADLEYEASADELLRLFDAAWK